MSRPRAIATAGEVDLSLLRQGGSHEIWTLGGDRLVIPRPREINERTAKGIIAEAERLTRR